MKKLNLQSSFIFSRMLQKMGTDIFTALSNEPGQPVTIRIADNAFDTSEGQGKVYGIRHTYNEQEGMISSMELTLLVVDNRKLATDYGDLLIWPIRYEHDNLDVDITSIEIFDDGTYIPVEKYYDGNVEIAESWLLEFQERGFL